MGKTTATAILANLLRSCDEDGNEFIDYSMEVSSSTDSNEYFTLMIKNAWRL
jgi:hypothetical protein